MANDIYKVSIEYESKDFTRAVQEYERFVQTTQQGARSENTAARASDNNTRSKRNLTRATRDLNSAQQRARQQFLATANSIAVLDGPLGGIASRFSAFGVLIGRIGIPLAALGIAFSALTFTAQRAVREFAEWEVALSTVENRLNSVGNQINLTTQDIVRMSESIALDTLANEQEVLAAANSLLTFRRISTDVFEDVLRAAQDLAASGFGDVQSSTMRLAKALEDPRQSLQSLSRAGVVFTREQQAVIRRLRDSGREAEAFAIILRQVEDQVGGAGLAQANSTLAGSLDTIGQGVRTLRRNFGELFAETTGLRTGLEVLANDIDGILRRRSEDASATLERLESQVDDTALSLNELQRIAERYDLNIVAPEPERDLFGFRSAVVDAESVLGFQERIIRLLRRQATEEQRISDLRQSQAFFDRMGESLNDLETQIDLQREVIGLTQEEERVRRILADAGFGGRAIEEARIELENLQLLMLTTGESTQEINNRAEQLEEFIRRAARAGNDLRRAFEGQRIAREINRIEESTQNTNEVLRVQVRILEEAREAGNNALTVTEARRQAELEIQRQMIETRAAIVAAAGATALLTGRFREAAQAAAEVARLANLIKEIEEGAALQLRVGELGRPDRAGGSGEDPNAQYIRELEALENYLERRREEILTARGFEIDIVIEQYAERERVLNEALDRGLISHQNYSARLEQIVQSREDRISEIERAAQAQRMGDIAGFFGSLAGIAQSGGDRFVKAVAAFRGAEAVINAWSAYSQVLADPAFIGRPWARAAAAANVLGAGLQAVSNIRNAGRGGSGGGATARAPRERREISPQRVMIQGLDPNALFSGQQLQNMFDALLDENDNRGRVFVVAR